MDDENNSNYIKNATLKKQSWKKKISNTEGVNATNLLMVGDSQERRKILTPSDITNFPLFHIGKPFSEKPVYEVYEVYDARGYWSIKAAVHTRTATDANAPSA